MLIEDNFDNGSLGTFWSSVSNYSVLVSPSGDGILAFDGPPSDNLNPESVGSGESRQATTQALDLRGGTVAFDLLIGSSGVTPWGSFENADGGEDIALSYSIDGGATYSTIQIFDSEAVETLDQFGSFSISLPDEAQTSSTILRWFQLRNSGPSFDHWALDNISITGVTFGTPGDDVLNGTAGPDVIDGLAGDDTINGNTGDDILIGGSGADTLNGGADNDTASYETASAAVTANLANPASNTGDAAGDTYTNIENLAGSDFDDILTGDSGDNELMGSAGNDSLDGGGGNDTAIFGNGGVAVDLDIMGLQTTGEGNDTLSNIENLASGFGDDILFGTSGQNTLTGGAGDDSLSGRGGNDTLNGGIGDDILIGGLGDDTHIGGDGIDTAVFGDGGVTVDLGITTAQTTGEGDDILTEIENVSSGTGDDTLTGDSSDNTLDGGAGSDVLSGGGGSDTLVGGIGEDILSGGDGVDDLFGGADNDVLDGGSAADNLSGGDGDDLLNGGLGNDVMDGGDGDDIYVVNSLFDRIVEAPGGGVDTVRAGVTFSLNPISDDIENLVLGGTAQIDGNGNGSNNIITGNNNSNVLAGGLGDDILNGRGGMDTLLGGAGNDRLNGGIANDVMLGGFGDDRYVVDRTTDLVIEYAGQGYDTVVSSANTFSLNHHSQALEAIRLSGTGNINALGNNGDNFLGGQAGDNVLSGGLGNDVLVANGGADTLNGGAGDDVLLGGRGDDIFNGGSGADRFVFDDQFDSDLILGFNAAEDVIDLRQVTNITDFADLQANHLSMVGNDAVISDGGSTITIRNISMATLVSDDFLF